MMLIHTAAKLVTQMFEEKIVVGELQPPSQWEAVCRIILHGPLVQNAPPFLTSFCLVKMQVPSMQLKIYSLRRPTLTHYTSIMCLQYSFSVMLTSLGITMSQQNPYRSWVWVKMGTGQVGISSPVTNPYPWCRFGMFSGVCYPQHQNPNCQPLPLHCVSLVLCCFFLCWHFLVPCHQAESLLLANSYLAKHLWQPRHCCISSLPSEDSAFHLSCINVLNPQLICLLLTETDLACFFGCLPWISSQSCQLAQLQCILHLVLVAVLWSPEAFYPLFGAKYNPIRLMKIWWDYHSLFVQIMLTLSVLVSCHHVVSFTALHIMSSPIPFQNIPFPFPFILLQSPVIVTTILSVVFSVPCFPWAPYVFFKPLPTIEYINSVRCMCLSVVPEAAIARAGSFASSLTKAMQSQQAISIDMPSLLGWRGCGCSWQHLGCQNYPRHSGKCKRCGHVNHNTVSTCSQGEYHLQSLLTHQSWSIVSVVLTGVNLNAWTINYQCQVCTLGCRE